MLVLKLQEEEGRKIGGSIDSLVRILSLQAVGRRPYVHSGTRFGHMWRYLVGSIGLMHFGLPLS